MNPGLHCPIVMVGSGSTDVGYECYADCCVLQQDRFGGGGSMIVWAGISYGYRT